MVFARYPLTFLLLPLSLCVLPLKMQASSPVDQRHPLSLVTAPTEFGLADGPAWDGWSLTIADPKNQAANRYVVSKKAFQKGPQGRRFSASFFNHGHVYVADNAEGAILRVESDRSLTTLHEEDLEADNTRRPNDLVVDRSGGIFFTLTKAGEVVYLSPDGTAKTVATGVETANGLILSPDESILYVAEFLPKRIVAFDVGEAGALSHRRVFATLDDGNPDLRGADGMTIDRAGNVYCAGPESMWVWAPDGTLLDQIPVEGKPINATFGGQQLRDLYITGFGGLHLQKMLVSGVSPQPADSSQPAHQDRPSVAIPEGVTPRLDVTYATYGTRDMLADLYVPPGEGPHPAVVIIHGGGWLNGDKTKFRAMGLDLAKRGFTTMAMAYRLGDEAPFPAAIHDCHAAVRFLRANAADYHVDPERIAAVGGSAGGHLAGLLATSADVAELQGDGGNAGVSSAIQCAVVMSGPMRIASGSVAERSLDPKVKKSNAKTFFRGTVDEKRDLYLLADAYEQIDAKTPPILFQYGGKEDPTKTAPSSEKLMELGIPTKTLSDYPDGKHGCWNRHPWFTPMLDDIEEWLREHL